MVAIFYIVIIRDYDSKTFLEETLQTAFTIGTIAGLLILLGALYLLRNYIEKIAMRMYLRLPHATRLRLRVIKRTLATIYTLATGACFYMLFTKEPIIATIFLIIALIQISMDIYTEEKLKDKNGRA
ncbi:hypothetical protein [Flavobacterium psychrotrophum]|uniref:hypothetical protein n=1 Tax=Flavobacterium psychrotrophum TaxID=2294119 RepID=UPI0013C532BD|nr:hypothetical protein [Flavobacterium psychrotrophum]